VLSGEDLKKIKALFREQDAEIESLKKQLLQLDEERAKVAKHEQEMVAFKIEYTKQVRENEATVKRYRQMIEQEKEYAITKFAKDLLEVRDAIRSAVENTDREAVLGETDLAAMKEKFEATLEGQQLTADIMDRVLGRFKLEQYDPIGQAFDPKMHEAVFTVKQSEQEEGSVAVTMQTGWKIGDRILRAAKVGIVKK
jgi:molecular chaperone GrpE